LPEREKDDGLHRQELENGIVRLEEILGSVIEQQECIQCKADTDVVDDGDVQVGAVDSAKQNEN